LELVFLTLLVLATIGATGTVSAMRLMRML
jgi:hypothetical protein